MTRKERIFIIAILSIVALMVAFDIVTDSKEAGQSWRLFSRGSFATANRLSGLFINEKLIFFIFRSTIWLFVVPAIE